MFNFYLLLNTKKRFNDNVTANNLK